MTGPYPTKDDDPRAHATVHPCPACGHTLTAPLAAPSDLIAPEEIMRRLDISDYVLDKMTKAGEIPSIGHGRFVRYPRAAFEAMMGGYSAARDAAIAKATAETEAAIRKEAARKLWLVERAAKRTESRAAAAQTRLKVMRATVNASDFLGRRSHEGAD